jgi:hypothetical protein
MASKKTTSGNRLDVGWQHGIDIENTSRKVQCKYCQKIFSGGIYRFKHHLAYELLVYIVRQLKICFKFVSF